MGPQPMSFNIQLVHPALYAPPPTHTHTPEAMEGVECCIYKHQLVHDNQGSLQHGNCHGDYRITAVPLVTMESG